MTSIPFKLRLVLGAVIVILIGITAYFYLRHEAVLSPSIAETSGRALAAEGYLGAESCRDCHREAFAIWEKSAHADAMTIASVETVKGDFVQDTTHTFDGQSYRMFTRNGSYFIEAPNRDGLPQVFDVDYTLGARQHENYLTRFPDGRLQVLPVYYDLLQKRWFDAAEGTLELGKATGPDDYYFWANHGRTWNKRCFDCHASQIRKNYDLKTDTYNTMLGDLSINCEACHGPGAAHVKFWLDAAEDPKLALREDRSLPQLNNMTSVLQVENCAQCHAQKAVLRSGYVPGDDFQDFYELFLIDAVDFYWPDGLPKKLAYPFLQFAGSQCFRKAGLTCGGCHAKHGSARTADLIADPGGVGLCARCHPNIAADVNGHTHHSPSGPGADCNACHLPQQFRNQLIMTDHRIASPVPENTVRLGIPNACNQAGCHADKSAEWASEWSKVWYGDYQDKRVAEVDVIHRGREGDVAAVPDLLALFNKPDTAPLLRAGLGAILGKLGDEAAVPDLMAALVDSHSAVRAQAAAALGSIGHPVATKSLEQALSDSVFSVRIRSVFALAKLDYVPVTDEQKARFNRALDELSSIVTGKGMMADDGNMHTNVGQIYEFRKRFDRALFHYQSALRFLPGLVSLQTRMQNLLDAEARYKKLVDLLQPHIDRDARALVALGLAYVYHGKADEGIGLLKRAVEKGVRSELVQTGLGDASRWQGHFGEAKRLYRAALDMNDDFPGAHRGLALLAYAQGDPEAGRLHWRRFVQHQGDAQQQIKKLMGTP